LEAYVDAIETHLGARRGARHVLTPRDFVLAKSWYQAGVPLSTVLAGIDRSFEAEETPNSLSYCRRRVEELVVPDPAAGALGDPPDAIPLGELASRLRELSEGLQRLSGSPGAGFEPALRKVAELLDLIGVSTRPNWEYLRRKLREIDDQVSAALLAASPESDLSVYRAEAMRAAERQKGRADPSAVEDAVTRYSLKRARERLGLPAVSLY